MDITPETVVGLTNLYQTPLTGIHDPIFARGVILDNGISSAAIISIDTVEVTDGTALVGRIARETGISTSNIILTATHDHHAPMISLQNIDGSAKSGPAAAAFVTRVENLLVGAIQQARKHEQPARVGVGHGISDVSINRDVLMPDGKYALGHDSKGPSDKTLWVLRLDNAAGQPIALLMNYAVHGTTLGAKVPLLSGDLPGAASRWVENHYQGKVVAPWTSGAAGDQAPVVSMASDSDGIRDFAAIDVLGRILGEAAILVADGIRDMDSDIRLWGREKRFTCPGQNFAGDSAEGASAFADAAPVDFRLGVLMIGKTAIGAVSAEVVTTIYQELREESPYSNTILITLANGRIGYVPQDASYDNPTFEVYHSPLKRGCGEATIVNGLVEMFKEY